MIPHVLFSVYRNIRFTVVTCAFACFSTAPGLKDDFLGHQEAALALPVAMGRALGSLEATADGF